MKLAAVLLAMATLAATSAQAVTLTAEAPPEIRGITFLSEHRAVISAAMGSRHRDISALRTQIGDAVRTRIRDVARTRIGSWPHWTSSGLYQVGDRPVRGVSTAVPEPTAALLFGSALLVGFARSRYRA